MKYVLTLLMGIYFANPALSTPSSGYIDKSIKKAAKKAGVPEVLLKAVCKAESLLDAKAFVKDDGDGSNNHAIGLCQVLVTTAETMGFKDERCHEDFTDRKSERRYKHCKLFGPYTNALYAARYLKTKLDKYNGSWINAIAAYNAGSVRICSSNGFYYSTRKGIDKTEKYKVQCIPGELINRKHVDRVIRILWKLKEEK